jgi:hypothetical protein
MKGLDKGGQGPTSGCCAIEEEEEGELIKYQCMRKFTMSSFHGESMNEVISGDQLCHYGVSIKCFGDCFLLHHQGVRMMSAVPAGIAAPPGSVLRGINISCGHEPLDINP